MGPVRAELMWQSVVDATEIAGTGNGGLDVLDLGGGTGGDAVRLALLGHRVTVVDPSPDALASLHRRAADADLGEAVRGIQGDTADLLDHVDPQSFDLVICHGVLEYVDDPAEALAAVSPRSCGRAGMSVSSSLAGSPRSRRVRSPETSRRRRRSWPPPLTRGTCVRSVRDGSVSTSSRTLLTAHGFVPVATNGLRVFADLVPSAIVDGEPGARDALFALERLVRTSHDFTAVSAGLQSIARLDLNSAPSDPGGKSAAL